MTNLDPYNNISVISLGMWKGHAFAGHIYVPSPAVHVKDKQGDEHNNKPTAEDYKNKFSDNVLQQWTVTP